MRLVLVDDDMGIRSVLWRELKSRFEVTAAADATHAFEALAMLTDVVAVVSDLDLGNGPDGLAVLGEAAKRHPASARLLISASFRAPDLARANPGIIHAWLPKPWPDRGVTSTLEALLARRDLAKGSQPLTRATGRGLPLEVDLRFATWSLFRMAYASDIELGGLRFPLLEAPPLGQEISITLHLPSGERPTISGRVARVEPQSGRFEVGVEFVALTPEQRRALEEAIVAQGGPGRPPKI